MGGGTEVQVGTPVEVSEQAQNPNQDDSADSSASPTSTPEPIMPGTSSMVPEHVRLDLNEGIVVAFADHPTLGRIAYVTHVRSGAQAVLDADSTVIERHVGSGGGEALLDEALDDAVAMGRIRQGLQKEGLVPRNPIGDWINLVRFDGQSYYKNSERGDRTSTEVIQLDPSQLGPVLYRVAFSLDANLLPISYQIRDGDAAYLEPGTTIHSVAGYAPSVRLAAIVNGEVWLFERSEPSHASPTPVAVASSGGIQVERPLPTPKATPTSAVAPIAGQSQTVLDSQARDELRRREVMENFPERMKTWIDEDTVSNQQKWDTLGAERSGAGWRSGELPEGPVVASSPFGGLSLHILPAL